MSDFWMIPVFEWWDFGIRTVHKNLQTDLVLTIQNLDEFGFQMPTEYLNTVGNWKVPVFESHWKIDFYSYIWFYHSKTDLQKSGLGMIHPKTRLLLVCYLQLSFGVITSLTIQKLDIMSDF